MGPGGIGYVTAAQLSNYWPAAAFNGTTSAQQAQCCLDATEEADSFLRARYGYGGGQPFIIQAWGNDVTKYTAWIAIYLLFSTRGFNPQNGGDAEILRRYKAAVGDPDKPGSGWFPGVASQRIHPDITPLTPIGQNPQADLPQVQSAPMRCWAQYRNGRQVVG
jgi:hypothetical protein